MNFLFKLNEVNSNWVFIFPIITSYLYGDVIYFLLSVSICIASFLYHFYKTNTTSKISLGVLRFFDIGIAILSYWYMFYFVHKYIEDFKNVFYFLLFVTIVSYFFSKKELGKRYNAHSYFHIAIGVVAGSIPLFA